MLYLLSIMLRKRLAFLFSAVLLCLFSCKETPPEPPAPDILQLVSAKIGTTTLISDQLVEEASLDQPLVVRFALALDTEVAQGQMTLEDEDSNPLGLSFSFLDNDKTISARPEQPLNPDTSYKLLLGSEIKTPNGETFPGASFPFKTLQLPLLLEEISINNVNMDTAGRLLEVPLNFEIKARFSQAIDPSELGSKISVRKGNSTLNLEVQALDSENKYFSIKNTSAAEHIERYSFRISTELLSTQNNPFEGFDKDFYTAIDLSPKFPQLSDDELLTKVQEQTFKYFWDFGHPVSGLSRERNTSGDLVTSGGSGFGVMAILVGIERGFISRTDGVARLQTMVSFLGQADRFHGAWSHWLSGTSGDVIAFSPNDNGGDLVETSFMAMGLLCARQYLNDQVPAEAALITEINTLWEGIEWDWYTRGQNALYWHWSADKGWIMNMKVSGYNEALITYLMAAASPTHGIDSLVYHQGWARNGGMANGNTYYNTQLPLGPALGGPLFFEHYTYLGINPFGLTDQYADYQQQVVNHSLINYQYCIDNPQNYVGYSADCWGLTASDGNSGYSAHAPDNDRGVITPTAALSSMPYTPNESMDALKHFYYVLGDKLWGPYGFYDAFNLTEGWVADSYLAIDQGPIICMIENHRTGLIWNLFMSAPETQYALDRLGFSY
ncbi:MAG: glucoamylase family protein [Bacteroidota bacterium]